MINCSITKLYSNDPEYINNIINEVKKNHTIEGYTIKTFLIPSWTYHPEGRQSYYESANLIIKCSCHTDPITIEFEFHGTEFIDYYKTT